MRNRIVFFTIVLACGPWRCVAEEWPLPPTPPFLVDVRLSESEELLQARKPEHSTIGIPLTFLVLTNGSERQGYIVAEKDLSVLLVQEDGYAISIPVNDIELRTTVPITIRPFDDIIRFRAGAITNELLSRMAPYPCRGSRRRAAIAEGGDKATEAAVDSALSWLARHQEPDGHWDAVRHHSQQKTDTACTGLALLAFLAAGNSERRGMYAENVRRAIDWLKSQQRIAADKGLIFDATDAGAFRGVGYPHAIAATALAEAAGRERVPETIEAAQWAVDYSIETHQDQRGGFRYCAGTSGDLSVTGWYLVQFKAAQAANLRVDPKGLERISLFLDQCQAKGEVPYYKYQPGNSHEDSAQRLTAEGNLCRQFLGAEREDLQNSITWFVEKGGVPGAWGEGKTDLYYWYYGTLCTFQQGGEVWKKWNDAMKRTLCDNQKREGDAAGSWDPVGDFSLEWGRVGQTALCCLCLEVYYRYPRVQKGP